MNVSYTYHRVERSRSFLIGISLLLPVVIPLWIFVRQDLRRKEMAEDEMCSSSNTLVSGKYSPPPLSPSSQSLQIKTINITAFMKYVADFVENKTSCYSWNDIAKEFIEIFKDYVDNLAGEFQEISGKAPDLSEGSEILRITYFIIEKVQKFDNFPFTWLRFCELLHQPTRSYKKMDAFMRALERVINVDTTVVSRRPDPEEMFLEMESFILKGYCDSGSTIDMADYPMEGSVDDDVASYDSDEDSYLSEYDYSTDLSDDERADYLFENNQAAWSPTPLQSDDENSDPAFEENDPFWNPYHISSGGEEEDALLEDDEAFLPCELMHPSDPVDNDYFFDLGAPSDDYFLVPMCEVYSEATVEVSSAHAPDTLL